MKLTEKQQQTLAAFNGKMKYQEVETIGLNGVKSITLKLVKVATKKEKKSNYFLGYSNNEPDSIRKFVKTDKEIRGQEFENSLNLPSSMRNY
jgi:spore coat polysaccharide biosynthesis predicted glycosyltransferase SpsG